MKKTILITLSAFSIFTKAQAQDETDALRYSFLTSGSTARGQAIGGALGSIGADFGGLSVNPATIARYSKNEVTFSPSYKAKNTPSTYRGGSKTDDNTKFNFDNLGIVIAGRKNTNKNTWRNTGFAFGVNRLADFNRNYTYSGTNTQSSIVNAYAEGINNNGGMNLVNQFSNGAGTPDQRNAWNCYLIDVDPNDSAKVKSFVPVTNLLQTKTVTQTGGINEMVFSFGGNYADQFMIGATLGIPFVNYNRTTIYTEDDMSGNTNNNFNYLKSTETVLTSGVGINLKIGAIYTPTNNMRFGIALHTPTSYQLTDKYSNNMEANVENLNVTGGPLFSTNDTGSTYNYALKTPARAIFSGSYIIGKIGFITADYETVNYRSANFKFGVGDEAYQSTLKNVIKTQYRTAGNIKVGGEVRLNNVSLRAGVAHYGNPYATGDIDGSMLNLSIGAGFRTKSFFFDATYINSQSKQRDYAYVYNAIPTTPATLKNNTNTVVFTIGWKY